MLNREEQLKEWDRVVAMCKGTKFEGKEKLCVKARRASDIAYRVYNIDEGFNLKLTHIDRIFAIAIVDDTPIWLEEPFTLYQHEDVRFIDMMFTYRSCDNRLIGAGRAREVMGVPLGGMKVSIPIDKVVWKNFTLSKPSKPEIIGILPSTAEEFISQLGIDDTFLQGNIKDTKAKVYSVGADSKQVGGTHYKYKAIQPWGYMEANFTKEEFVGFLRGNAHKYLDRYKDKNGVEDLKKAIHYIEKLIQVESE